jgi:hypothetical protein
MTCSGAISVAMGISYLGCNGHTRYITPKTLRRTYGKLCMISNTVLNND